MRLRIALLALLLIILVLPLPMHGDDADCSTTPSIRLAIGVTARVMFRGGLGAIVYEYPGTRFKPVATLSDGAVVRVLAGPTCADTSQWWRVTTTSGADGWLDEGAADQYKLEPWPVVLDLPRRSRTGIDIQRIKAADASAYTVAALPIKPIAGSVSAVFPPSEWRALDALLRDDFTRCPDVIASFDPAIPKLKSLDDLPADTGALESYLSPDGSRVLMVHHLWRTAIDCGGKPTPAYGLDRVTLLSAVGERPLGDFPINAQPPTYNDRFPNNVDSVGSSVIDAGWSPDQQHVWLFVAFTDRTNGGSAVYRVYICDLATGSLTDLGDGLHPSWLATGDRLGWFRLIYNSNGSARQALFTAKADGSDVHEMSLPDRITFVDSPIGGRLPPWNTDGSQIVGCAQTREGACTTLAAYRLDDHTTTPIPGLVPSVQRFGWLNDTLLYGVTGDSTLILQPIAGPATTIALPAIPMTLVPFADGTHLLADGDAPQLIDTQSGAITAVHVN
jgi:hypothetical protein